MTKNWVIITKLARRKNRARVTETKVTTFLCYSPDCYHVLRGEHGRKILESVAAAWNARGVMSPAPSPRCRADFATEAARQRFTLGIS